MQRSGGPLLAAYDGNTNVPSPFRVLVEGDLGQFGVVLDKEESKEKVPPAGRHFIRVYLKTGNMTNSEGFF